MSEIQNSSIFALDDISDEEMSNLIDGTVTDFDEGGLVTGTVVKIERDEELSDDEQSREKKAVQKITDTYVAKIEDMLKSKSAEVMEI